MQGGQQLVDNFVLKSTELVGTLVGRFNRGGCGSLAVCENGTLMMLAPPVKFVLKGKRQQVEDDFLSCSTCELRVTAHFVGLVHGPRWAFDDDHFQYKETNKLSYKKAIALFAKGMNAAAAAKRYEPVVHRDMQQFLSSWLH